MLAPEAGAGQEIVFEAGADHLLQVGVGESVGFDGADIFVREVNARDAFVVCGERDRHAEFAIDRERVILAADAENQIVAAEINFHHHVFCSHFLQQIVGPFLVHDVHTVADAFGVRDFDSLANVKGKPFVGDEAGSEFTGVQSDVNFGVHTVQEADHAHLQSVVGHGDVAIFGHHEIDADDARVGGGDFETEQSLRENLLGGKSAQNLVDVTELHGAGGGWIGLVAAFGLAADGFGFVEIGARYGDVVAQAFGEKLIAEIAEAAIGVPAEFFGDGGGVLEGRSFHQFEVLLVLRGGAGGDFVEKFAGVDVRNAVEFREGVEEMIVAADAGGGDETAHGECVNERVVEMLIGHGVSGGDIAVAADGLRREAVRHGARLEKRVGGEIHAEIVFGGGANPGFGVDRAGEVVVQVRALGHADEKCVEIQRIGAGEIERVRGAIFGRGLWTARSPRISERWRTLRAISSKGEDGEMIYADEQEIGRFSISAGPQGEFLMAKNVSQGVCSRRLQYARRKLSGIFRLTCFRFKPIISEKAANRGLSATNCLTQLHSRRGGRVQCGDRAVGVELIHALACGIWNEKPVSWRMRR